MTEVGTDWVPAAVPRTIRRALQLLDGRARRRYALVILAEVLTSLLDLLGVLLVGATVVLVYAVPAGAPIPGALEHLLERFGLDRVDGPSIALWTGAAAAVLLLAKSAISAVLLRRAFAFLARQQAGVAARLTRSWFGAGALRVQATANADIENALGMSTYYATTGLLGSTAVAVAEGSLLVVLSVTLIVIDPVAALLAGLTFALVALVVHRVLGRWAAAIGLRTMSSAVAGRTAIQESIESYRELRTARRIGFPISAYSRHIRTGALGAADLMFVNNVPKIAYEAALVLGAVVLVVWRTMQGDVVSALAFLAVFLTAAARLLPSMVRLQGQLVTMANSASQASAALDLADRCARSRPVSVADLGTEVPAGEYPQFDPVIVVDGVHLTYPAAPGPALDDVSFEVAAGSSLVMVGPTGAGKSSLVDVILGLVPPDRGRVLIGGMPPQDAQGRWPGAIAYMPQHSAIWNASIRSNVALGLPDETIDDDAVWMALEQAHLAADIRAKGGLDTIVGPAGRTLSGGQRQRLGIARALYSRPRLLVLDEATSALDERTESLIASMLDTLRGEVTVLAVAHRRSTIERAARVVQLEHGRVVYLGPPAGVHLPATPGAPHSKVQE